MKEVCCSRMSLHVAGVERMRHDQQENPTRVFDTQVVLLPESEMASNCSPRLGSSEMCLSMARCRKAHRKSSPGAFPGGAFFKPKEESTMKEAVKRIDVEVEVGEGRYPGSHFREVAIRIRHRRTGVWSVNVVQTSGCYPSQEDEITIVGFGNELPDAVADAETRAREVKIDARLLAQAVSQAREEVEDELERILPKDA